MKCKGLDMKEYSTAILCGGRSRRMGEEKALLDWFGKPLLAQILGGFPACGDILLSVRDPAQAAEIPGSVTMNPQRIRMIPDEMPDCGPMAGLASCLQAARNPLLFVTACDAPFADAETAEYLAGRIDGYDAAVPVSEDGIHPLIALYRKEILHIVRQNLLQKQFRPKKMLAQLRVCYVPAAELPQGWLTVANLNTPEEAERFREEWRRRKNTPDI